MIKDYNTKYQKVIDSKRWRPATDSRRSNDTIFPKVYTAEINNIVTDDLKKGYFSNRKVNTSVIGGNNNNNSNDGKWFKVKCHKFGKKGHRST